MASKSRIYSMNTKDTVDSDIIKMEYFNEKPFYSQLGDGGGEHIACGQIFEIDNINITRYKFYKKTVDMMLKFFIKQMPNIKINNYSLEHRIYKMNNEEFIGDIHNDCCEYTIIYYYHIDNTIEGGDLGFYSEDKLYEIYSPKQGDIIIFSGDHQVLKLNGKGYRKILTVFINGHP